MSTPAYLKAQRAKRRQAQLLKQARKRRVRFLALERDFKVAGRW